MSPGRATGTLRWIVAALSAAWIATIVPALPHAISQGYTLVVDLPVDWRDRYLSAAAMIGYVPFGFCWSLSALLTGTVGPDFSRSAPLSSQGWLLDVLAWGWMLGLAIGAALPPWILWLLFRPRKRVTTPEIAGAPPAPPSVPVGLPADPSFAVAAVWSVVLLAGFGTLAGRDLLGPGVSALMMPPLRGSGTDVGAPLSEWCAYSFHARPRECETARRRLSPVGGFGVPGAKCIGLADLGLVERHEAAVARVARVLEQALTGRARVEREHPIGREIVDLAVLELAPAEAVLVAVDVGEDSSDRVVTRRAGRFAAAGVPDYWRIELHPSRGTPIDDAIRVWTLPNAATGQYAKVSGSSRNPDAWLRLGAFPDLRIPVDDVLAPACPERSR